MKLFIALLLAFTPAAFAHETDVIDDVIQISTGGPLISPANDGIINLRTKESAVLFESMSDANSVYVQTGAVTVSEAISGMIRLVTGPGSGVEDGYSGNVEAITGDSSGDAFSGDVHLSAGVNGDVADNGGRVRFSAIRTKLERGFFQLYKDADPPAGATVEAGDMYYDTDDNKVKVYNGSQWKTLAYE